MTLKEWLAMTEAERRAWSERQEQADEKPKSALTEAERRERPRPPFGAVNEVET